MPDYASKQSRVDRAREAARTADPSPGKRTLVEQSYGPVATTPRQPMEIGGAGHASTARGAATPAGGSPPGDWIQSVFGAAASGPKQEVPFRREMELSFGRDLSSAKVVLDRPKEMAAIGAAAATRGNTIVFAKASPSKLEVAHELTHFVQNNPAPTARGSSPNIAHATLSAPGDSAEHEADSVAQRAAAGEPVSVHASPTGAIQRMLVGWELETIVPIYENGARPDHVDGFASQNAEYAHQNVDDALRGPLGDGFEIHVDSSSLVSRSALNKLNPDAKMHIAEIVAKPVQSRAALLGKMTAMHKYLSHFQSNRELIGGKYSMGWPVPQSDWEAPAQAGAEDGAHQAASSRVSREDLEKYFAADWQASQNNLYDVSTQLTMQGPPESLKTIADLDKTSYQKRIGQSKPGERVRTETVDHSVVKREKMASALGVSLDGDLATRAVDVAVKIFKDSLFFITRPFTGTVKNSVAFLIRSDLNKVFADLDPVQRNEFAASIKDSLKNLDPKSLGLTSPVGTNFFDKERKNVKVNNNVYNLIKYKPEREAGELEHLNPGLQTNIEKNVGEDKLLPWGAFIDWFADQVYDAVREQPSGNGKDVTGPLHGSQNLGILPEEGDGQAPQARVVFENRKPLQVRIDGNALPAEIVEELDLVGFPK